MKITRKDIERAVAALFVSGFGEKADRLILNSAGKNLGGWGQKPMTDRLCELLKIKNDEEAK